jgi:ubiquinone biosynthesis protein Coq4
VTQQSLRNKSPFRGKKSSGFPATLIAEFQPLMVTEQKNYVRSSFSEGVTKLGISILQTAKQPERIFQHGRYLGIPGSTKLQKECIERILATPKVQELLVNRPSPLWPDLEQMAAMPKRSLGWCVHRRLEKLGICFLVDQSQIPESQTDEEFAGTRAFRLHDIHHTILGLPITVAGEAAATAFYASTGSVPTDIGTLSSWMLRGAYEPSERRLIWDAIGFGIAVGQKVPELFSPRWEEGWERPITDWQDELGISELLKTSPFQDEFATIYGFNLD